MEKFHNLLFILITAISSLAQENPEVYFQMGHRDNITSLCFSPDSKYIITGSKDKTLKLWSVERQREIRTFRGHTGAVTDVCYSATGNFVFSASADSSIRMWNVTNGTEIKKFSGHYDRIQRVIVSPDGKKMASLDLNSTIKFWDINTAKEVISIDLDKSGYFAETSLSFTPDGTRILIQHKNSIKIWDISKNQIEKSFSPLQNENILSVHFTADGKRILITSSGNSIYEVDLTAEIILFSYNIKDEQPRGARFMPDGNIIFSYGCFNLGILDYQFRNLSKVIKDEYDCVDLFEISPDGKYICHAYHSRLQLRSLAEGFLYEEITNVIHPVTSVRFCADDRYIIFTPDIHLPLFWDVNQLVPYNLLPDSLSDLHGESLNYSQDLKYASFRKRRDNYPFRVMDLKSEKDLVRSMNIKDAVFSPDMKRLLVRANRNHYFLLEWPGLKEIRRYVWDAYLEKDLEYIRTEFSPSGNYFAAYYVDEESNILAQIFDIDHLNAYYYSKMKGPTGTEFRFSPKDTYIANFKDREFLSVYEINSNKKLLEFPSARQFDWSSDERFIVFFSGRTRTIQVIEITTKKKIFEISTGSKYLSAIRYSKNGLYIAGAHSNKIFLWEAQTGRLIKELSGHGSWITGLDFSADGRLLVSASEDGTIRLNNLQTGNSVSLVRSNDNDEWIIYTDEGYWDGSPNCEKLVAVVQGMSSWNIDQFAVRNNRPDIILEKMGCQDKNLISHYYYQYKKRLRKLGLLESRMESGMHFPESKILSTDISDKNCTVQFSIQDSKYLIVSYNIYLNNVPLFGAWGKKVHTKEITLKETFTLSTGKNKIEVSCTNEQGVESFRSLTYAFKEAEVKSDLYFLGFGVSKYKNSSLNLQFADKDALDLEETFKMFRGKQFENIYTKTYINEQVTPENIKISSEFLKNARPDDYFILFIAGHGLHDNDPEAKFYFLTSNSDLENLRGTAIDFETIESLLQGIPPRNKLFLMDACESGELDETENRTVLTELNIEGINSRGFKKSELPQIINPALRSIAFDKNRYIYYDLLRRSGSIVFSSSKGNEFSFENSELQNGLFTEYVISALVNKVADYNKDDYVSIDELRDFVVARVSEISRNQQHPTIDRDNIFQRLKFYVGK